MAYQPLPSLGQAAMAASLPVVVASDQSALDIKQETHDNLNLNANIQVGNLDVTTSNPVPIQPPLSGFLNVSIDQTGSNNVVNTELLAAAVLADDTANPTITSIGTFPHIYDRTDSNWDRLTAIHATLNTAAADSGILAAGMVAQFDDTSPTSVTENQFGNLRMTATRDLHINIRNNAGTEIGTTTTPIRIDNTNGGLSTYITDDAASGIIHGNDNIGFNNANGILILGQRRDSDAAIISSDNRFSTFATDSSSRIKVTGNLIDDNAFTPATHRVFMAGFFADETATDSVDEGDGGAARMTLDRKVITATYAHTAGGAGPYIKTALTTTVQTVISSAAGTIYGGSMYNPNSTPVWVQCFDVASATTVTLGTTVPNFFFSVPGLSTTNLASVFGEKGWSVTNGLKIAATTTSTGSTAMGTTTGQDISLLYK